MASRFASKAHLRRLHISHSYERRMRLNEKLTEGMVHPLDSATTSTATDTIASAACQSECHSAIVPPNATARASYECDRGWSPSREQRGRQQVLFVSQTQ